MVHLKKITINATAIGYISSLFSAGFIVFCMVVYMFIPSVQKTALFNTEGLASFLKSPVPYLLFLCFKLLFFISFLGVVIYFYILCRKKNVYLMAFLSLLAFIGMSGIFMSLSRYVLYLPKAATLYMASDVAMQQIILDKLDLYGTLNPIYGLLISFWLVYSSWTAKSYYAIPINLVFFGSFTGMSFFVTFFIDLLAVPSDITRPLFLVNYLLLTIFLLWEAYFAYRLEKRQKT